MSLDQIANIAEIVGLILVIASLFYVAKQLKQNTNAVLAQTRHAVLAASQAELFEQINHPDLGLTITRESEREPEAQVKLNSWLFAIFRAREFAWLQFNHGYIDETQWATELEVLKFFLDSTRVRTWWRHVGRRAFGDDYVAFVEEVAEENNPTDSAFRSVAGWDLSSRADVP